MKRSSSALRRLALCLCLILALGTLAGCSEKKEEESAGGSASAESTLHIVLTAPYVDEEAVEAFAASLREALPELDTDTQKISVTGISMGYSDVDPMGTMAGITRLTGMMASGEVDLLISDAENAARNDRNEAFVPLSELEGLEAITTLQIHHYTVDDEGRLTDEALPPSGVSLAGNNEMLSAIFGDDVGAYVVQGTTQQAQAVQVINELVIESVEEKV